MGHLFREYGGALINTILLMALIGSLIAAINVVTSF